jgi:hypothetical protein
MTHPQVNVEGPQPGDRVQVEARGRVLAVETRGGEPWVDVMLTTEDGATVFTARLPAEMLVLLDPRTTPS